MWSVGCIICELVGRKPIFKGKDHLSQLTAIVQVLGTPPKDVIIRISSTYVSIFFIIIYHALKTHTNIFNNKAWDFFNSSVQYSKTPFTEVYPNANIEALDLVDELLKYDPSERLSAEAALNHPYLRMFHLPEDEPDAPEKFNFDFEKLSPSDLERKYI